MRSMLGIAVVCLLGFPLLALAGPQVTVSQGILEGSSESDGLRVFKGVPFAKPPVGPLRWHAPEPMESWQGVRQATEFGPHPLQLKVFGDMQIPSPAKEDCLYLNVWAPPESAGKKLPVLVYFYGGGFVAGAGDEARYSGASMARRGIVAITINYRLGVFGFLAHPELTAESKHHSSGNYALLDQQMSLQWVRDNIAAFGGDPGNVTIAGESAGSISVSAQMVSPMSKGLFAAAIGESGSLLGTLSPVPLAQGEAAGVAFARDMGNKTIAELREIPAEVILTNRASSGMGKFPLVIDGYFLPETPKAIFEAGKQAQVPLLVGWNSEEISGAAVLRGRPPTRENFTAAVKQFYPANADEVLAAYVPADGDNIEQAATDLASDRFISLSTWRWAHLHAKNGNSPVFRYYYTHPRPAVRPELGGATLGLAGGINRPATAPGVAQPPAAKAPAPPPPNKGAVHSAEIEYAMGNLPLNNTFAWTDTDHQVSETLQSYFANFIKTHDPSSPSLPAGRPAWPAMNSDPALLVMVIGAEAKVENDSRAKRYELLDRISP